MNKSIRDKWCEKEISDLDYIRHLEAENAKLKEPNTCNTCKFSKDAYRTDLMKCLNLPLQWNQYVRLDFGCVLHEPKEQP